jgi:hypothetical protein
MLLYYPLIAQDAKPRILSNAGQVIAKDAKPTIPSDAGPALDQDAKPKTLANAGQANKAAEAPIKYTGARFQSGNRRDPFLNPSFLKKKAKQQDDEEIARGLPPPGIAGTYIAQAVFQGVTLRESSKVAVIRGADSRAYFIRAGDRLFDGYLKDIQNDSITFVRETKLKSGKTLTQDVTKRLRTQ